MNIMPIIEIKLLEGRTVEQKRKIVEAICKVFLEETGTPSENITVTFSDLKEENIATKGKLKCD